MELEQLFGKDCVPTRSYIDLRMSSMPKVEEFVIGKKTMERILLLNLECQRCGNCCQYKGKSCKELENEAGMYSCRIHDKPEYSLTCFSYPFRLDVLAIEGIGLKYTQRSNQQTGKPLDPNEEDFVWYELGCVTGALMLTLYSSDPALGKGKEVLAKRALQVMNKLLNTEAVPIAPPADFLCSGVVVATGDQFSGKTFTEAECRDSMEQIKESDFRSFRALCEMVSNK
jgi:hypothetical protein